MEVEIKCMGAWLRDLIALLGQTMFSYTFTLSGDLSIDLPRISPRLLRTLSEKTPIIRLRESGCFWARCVRVKCLPTRGNTLKRSACNPRGAIRAKSYSDESHSFLAKSSKVLAAEVRLRILSTVIVPELRFLAPPISESAIVCFFSLAPFSFSREGKSIKRKQKGKCRKPVSENNGKYRRNVPQKNFLSAWRFRSTRTCQVASYLMRTN